MKGKTKKYSLTDRFHEDRYADTKISQREEVIKTLYEEMKVDKGKFSIPSLFDDSILFENDFVIKENAKVFSI
jgi:hypothetical protein